jgi:tricorn protease-like protein/C-terminal processing protease CtpA/Prc
MQTAMLTRALILTAPAFFAIVAPATALDTADPSSTRGLCRYPDISKDSIVFIYGNDLWIVPKEGGTARPVANPPGFEGSPRFSPDGKSIAFRANYDQGLDLYTLAVDGGIPQRVTHHPAPEGLCDWTPDGKGLIFMGNLGGLTRASKLYSVPATGGLPEQLPVPYGANGSLDKSGEWLAYTPHSTDTRTWKRYRGGMATDIWLFNIKTGESKRITDWEGTDTLPMWNGRKVYFLSDRSAAEDNVLNVWSYDIDSGKTEQVTRFKTHDVKWPAIGPDSGGSGEMVLQHGDQIFVLDLATNAARPVSIKVPGDRETLRVAVVDAAPNIQGASISPSGKRVAVVGRGDIWSAPAENGTPRNMTRTDGVFERSAAWSPDGKTIAFFSDATGEYELYTMPADGKPAEDGTPVQPKQITKPVEGVPSAFRTDITWAPDSKSVVIQDKAGQIDLVKIEDGSSVRLDKNPEAPRSVTISFSHDSRWIAWSRSCDGSELDAIYLHDTKEADPAKARTQVTSGFYSDSDPTFDRKGDWLVFTSSRNFSPTYGDFDTTWIYNNSQVLMAVPLKKDFKLPWLPTSDEEGQKDDGKSSGGGGGAPAAGAGAPPAGGPPAGGRRRRGAEGEEANLIAASPEAALVQEENKDAKKDSAASSGAAGTWNCMVRIDNAPVAVKLVLTETDGTVKGTASSIMGATELVGTYDAATGALKLSGNFNGMVFELDLKVEGDSLTGTASGPGEDGAPMKIEMTGTRVAEKKDGDGDKKDDKKDEKKEEKKEVVIDLDGFEARAVQLPAAAGSFGSLGFNDRNELLYGREGSVRVMDLSAKAPSESTGASGVRFDVSADGKKLLMGGRGGASIAGASAGASAKPIVASPMLVEIHPRHEREQILVDAWRIFRDYFYDQGMHGVDWNAIRAKYEAMLPAVVTREDLNFLIAEMISELNVGHAYLQGPGDVEETSSRSVGMLAVEFAPATNEDGTTAKAWKLAKFVNGASFDNEARSPLSAQGLGVSEGDYLLAVNGEPVDPSRDPWAQFLDLAGKSVVLTVSKKPTMDKDAKDVVVTALGSESNLHYRAWVESKRRQVEELSGGKIGYIYVPNTGVDGQTELVRQFYGQRMKPSLIIDDRWNGGGQIPTRFIELLNRPVTNYWARRDARDGAWPPDGHRGPMAMLINGLAGSGGDMFPWLFKHNKLGPVIGTRTWGGLVGISGNPGLIDGGSISVPTFGFYETDGTWGVEGHGIDPDIEVIDDPAKMKDGRDPQLEKAVEVLLKELETNAYKPVPKPKGPNRSGMGLPVTDR